ncbi:MAG TPA: rRNA maturation RNase YbeY, partial [Myxococcales bacterium]|nr:rRNA maturation RNase YbeY [Myxococcales bacterium]
MANLILVRSEHPEGAYAVRVLRQGSRLFLARLGLDEVELSVVVTTDAEIRTLNRKWRKKDRSTDVLSFPAGDGPVLPGQKRWLGDVVLSLDTARARAQDDGRPVSAELSRYLAHGLLHLLGHDHHAPGEAGRMARAEAGLLRAGGGVARGA